MSGPSEVRPAASPEVPGLGGARRPAAPMAPSTESTAASPTGPVDAAAWRATPAFGETGGTVTFGEGERPTPPIRVGNHEVTLPKAWQSMPEAAKVAIARVMAAFAEHMKTHEKVEMPMPAAMQAAFDDLFRVMQDPAVAQATYAAMGDRSLVPPLLRNALSPQTSPGERQRIQSAMLNELSRSVQTMEFTISQSS